MNQQELEERFIRSLDVPMTAEENKTFLKEMERYPELAKTFLQHEKIRSMALRKVPASFGPYFASKLMNRIENTGVVIDRQLFSFFKKYQLVAAGVIVGLLILNVMFTDQLSLTSIFGLETTTAPATEETVASFNFFELLNKNL